MRISSNSVVRICLRMLKMKIFLVIVRRGHFVVLCCVHRHAAFTDPAREYQVLVSPTLTSVASLVKRR